jgi:hypothetical protein
MDSEKFFVTTLKDCPQYTLSYGMDLVEPEKISEFFGAHLQTWFALMHHTCANGGRFQQICDVAFAHTECNKDPIKLIDLEIRPCAENLDLFKMIICQLLKSSQRASKSLSITAPTEEHLAFLAKFNGTYKFKQYTIPLDRFSTMRDDVILFQCEISEKCSFDEAGNLIIRLESLPSEGNLTHRHMEQTSVDAVLHRLISICELLADQGKL